MRIDNYDITEEKNEASWVKTEFPRPRPGAQVQIVKDDAIDWIKKEGKSMHEESMYGESTKRHLPAGG